MSSLAGSLGGELFAGGLATGGLTCDLLGTRAMHFESVFCFYIRIMNENKYILMYRSSIQICRDGKAAGISWPRHYNTVHGTLQYQAGTQLIAHMPPMQGGGLAIVTYGRTCTP